MSITPLGAVGAAGAVSAPLPPAPLGSTGATTGAAGIGAGAGAGAAAGTGAATQATGNAGFAQALAGVVDNLQVVQANADRLSVQAATGALKNPHDYLLAASEASMTTQLTVAVRNKALESFNEIMRMPL